MKNFGRIYEANIFILQNLNFYDKIQVRLARLKRRNKMNKRKILFFALFFVILLTAFARDTTKKVEPNNKVYVTAKGKKYHYKHCRTLNKAKKLKALTISQAKKKGYKPCKVCKPPVKESKEI